MRIVIATPLYPPEIGGPATYAKILVEELPKRGIEVDLVKFSDVRRLPNAIRQIAFFGKILARARRVNIILALDPVSVGWPSYFANLFLRKKFIVKVVGDHVWEQGTQRFGVASALDAFPSFSWQWNPYLWLLRRLQFLVVRGADIVVVPSEYLKKIVMVWGVPSNKIRVIYNTVTLESMGVVPDAVGKLSRPLIVTAGRLVSWKQVDGVIDAVANVARASLAVVGDGPGRGALMRRAEEKLPGRAVFTGTLSHADTLAVIKCADVFVLNSSYEGLSHLLIEALMLGVPIVATRAGGNGEVIEDRVNGTLIPVGDTEALARALRERRTPMPGATARFTEERMVSSTVELLKNL